MPDPFAQYAVSGDPFAAYATGTPENAKASTFANSGEGLAAHKARGPEVLSDTPSDPSLLTNTIEAMRGVAHPETLSDLAPLFQLGGIGGAIAGAKALAGNVPGGRLITAGWAGTKAAAKGNVLTGPLYKGAQGALRSWKATAPQAAAPAAALAAEPAAAPAVMHGPAVKPKLSAPEVAAKLREQYGSERAGQMLYGKVQRGADAGSVSATAAARKDAIKRLAPGGSALPSAAKAQIDQRLLELNPEQAFQYATQAPNAPAQSYIGEQLRAALLERLRTQGKP